MKSPYYILSLTISICTIGLLTSQQAVAQTATINIQTTPASCTGGGSVTGSVSVPGACSIDGYLPCTTASLHGPGQSGSSFNTCHQYQVGASNLAPGDYYYRVTALSPCSGTADFPFTITGGGVYPDISITHTPIDCSDDDYITVQNNSSATVNVGILNGAALGSIAAGQSMDYPNTTYNLTLTASTSSCPTPVEYPGQYPFGFATIAANTSSVNPSNGQSNGSVTVNITNGQAPFTISWSNGETVSGEITSTISDLASGPYTVDITDNNGCTFSETVVISDFTGIESLAASLENVSIAPNPASGNTVSLNVRALHGQTLSISVVNSLGQEVVPTQQFTVVQGSNRLGLDHDARLTNGLYSLRITTEDKVGSLPFLYVQD